MKKIAVFGTLKRGYKLYDYYMQDSEFIGEGTVQGYKMYNVGWYPAIVKSDDKDVIHVEVFNMPENDYENVKTMEMNAGYNVEEVEVILGDNIITAQIFTMSVAKDNWQLIKSGRF